MEEQDPRLKQWKTWMDIRKETYQKITAKTGRDSGDMVMNSTEDIHENIENKLIIQYTDIANKPDKYRGCPDFYELPPSLFETFWKTSPTYFSITPKDKGCTIPDIEYIRTEDVIRDEKGISPSIDKSKLKFLTSKYLQYRRNELQEKLLEIEPHKPTGDFTIIGQSICKPPYPEYQSPDQNIPSKAVERISPASERIIPILKINDTIVYNKSNGNKEININMEFDVASNDPRTDLFTITNYCSKSLRFSWRKIVTSTNFESCNMLYEIKQQGFFFNLNQFVVIPQETKSLPMYFKSKSEGLYKELWQLLIVPDLWSNKLHVKVKFNCVAVVKSFDVRSAFIKKNLQDRVRERIIDESLRNILSRVPEKKPEYMVYRYDKATIFEAVNSIFSPINLRPKYIYNKSVVTELETFYASVKLDHHPDVWNLNLNTLRQYTKERELRNAEIHLQEQYKVLQEKIFNATAIRNAREDLRQKLIHDSAAEASKNTSSKPSKGDKKSAKSKPAKSTDAKSSKGQDKKLPKTIDKVPVTVPLIKRHDISQTLTQQLDDIVKKLHQPITWTNEQQQKLSTAYSLFCAYFDNIQSDIDILNSKFHTDSSSTYPHLPDSTPSLPIRMISEYHDDTLLQMDQFRESCGLVTDKQAQPWVNEIPLGDYQTRYRAFHCIVDDPKLTKKVGNEGKSVKGGKKKDKDSIKSKVTEAHSEKSGGRVGDDVVPHLTVIDYDPYAEVVVKVPRSRTVSLLSQQIEPRFEVKKVVVLELKPTDVELYKNNLYTIFYGNLGHAIDDLETLLHLQSKLTVHHNIIQKVTDGFTVQTANEPETVKIVDLRKVISECLNSKEAQSNDYTRPCYKPRPKSNQSVVRTTSDSSLWDILQKPKVNVKPLEPGEYTLMKTVGRIETHSMSTSVTDIDADFSTVEYNDESIQVETWDLPRNVDCDIYCECGEEKDHDACRVKSLKWKLNVKTANEYSDLMIDGTQNFKFYDEEEAEAEVPPVLKPDVNVIESKNECS